MNFLAETKSKFSRLSLSGVKIKCFITNVNTKFNATLHEDEVIHFPLIGLDLSLTLKKTPFSENSRTHVVTQS